VGELKTQLKAQDAWRDGQWEAQAPIGLIELDAARRAAGQGRSRDGIRGCSFNPRHPDQGLALTCTKAQKLVKPYREAPRPNAS